MSIPLPPCLDRPADAAREPELDGAAWNERHLQCIWADSTLRPKALFTTGGRIVRVVDPGRWNGGPGPDFNDAVFELDGEARRGSVEIHVRPGDWFDHGHDCDPEYRDVALHVSWFPPSSVEAAPEIPLVVLRDAMLERPGFSFDQIDPSAYPERAAAEPARPCRNALAGLSAAETAAWLERAGQSRVRRFARDLEARATAAESREQAFYEAFMGALGFRRNAAPMRALARRVPAASLASLPDNRARYATLLAAAGLIPGTASSATPAAWIKEVWDAAFASGASYNPDALSSWSLSGLRPANHPRVRLAAAAALFANGGSDLLAGLEGLPRSDARAWVRSATRILREGAAPGRELAPPAARRAGAPLGTSRIMAALANVVVPWIARFDEDAWRLADALPGEDVGAPGREMALRLLGPDHNPSAIYASRSIRIQGLLELWNGYCSASPQACRSCPLASMSGASASAPRRSAPTINQSDRK